MTYGEAVAAHEAAHAAAMRAGHRLHLVQKPAVCPPPDVSTCRSCVKAESRLADRERQLGTARAIIAAQNQQIDDLRAELATFHDAATPVVSHDEIWA